MSQNIPSFTTHQRYLGNLDWNLGVKCDLVANGRAHGVFVYDDADSLWEKINTIATRIYRADEAIANKSVRDQLKNWEEAGFGNLPICMAKTQYSLSHDANLLGRPSGFTVPIREIRLSAGAGFVTPLCGEMRTMPGLPSVPGGRNIDIDADGNVVGLF